MKPSLDQSFDSDKALQAHKDHTCTFETCQYCHQAILHDEVRAAEGDVDEHETNVGIG